MSIKNWYLNYPNCYYWWVEFPQFVHARDEVYFTAKELYLYSWRLKKEMVCRIKVYLFGHLKYTIIRDTEAECWDTTTELREKYGNNVDFIVEEVYLNG